MKPSHSRSLRFRLILLGAATLSLTNARAEETTSEIKFSDPTKPGVMKIFVARGNLRVRGVDAPATATVKSETKPVRSTPRKDGLRELAGSSAYSLVEKDNVITLDASGDGVRSASDFNLTVPRNTSLIISNSWGGDISCIDVGGDLEIKNMNGRIKLEGVAGGVLVETMNGEVTADVHELHEGKPLSFTSMNGEIIIRIPADAKANVRLRSQNGAILTDFDEKEITTKTESLGGRSRNAKSSRNSNDSDIQVAVKEVVKAGVEAAHEAAAAIREATAAAREAMQEDRDRRDNSDGVPRPPRPALPPMTGGKIVTGTVNQGGPEIQAATMNGDVTLRKLDKKK